MLILLAFLSTVTVPPAAPLVDCPTACRQCRVRAVPRDMMLIYCSVCEECRMKTKKRKQAARRNAEEQGVLDVYNNAPEQAVDYMEYDEEMYNNPDAAYLLDRDENVPEQQPDVEKPVDVNRLRKEDYYYYSDVQYDYPHKPESYYKILDSLNIPEGCPTPPICDSDDEPPPPRQTTTTTTSPTTTTTTTSAPPSCPPIPECIIVKRTTRRRPRTTTPLYDYPALPPQPPFPYPPYPCMPSCMMPAMCPCPYPQPPAPAPIQNQYHQQLSQFGEPQAPPAPPTPPAPTDEPTTTTSQKLKVTSAELPAPVDEQAQDGLENAESEADFVNVYVGVPKSMTTVQAE